MLLIKLSAGMVFVISVKLKALDSTEIYASEGSELDRWMTVH